MRINILLGLSTIENGISFLVNGLIVLFYIANSRLRQNFTLRVICYLTLANFLWSFFTLILVILSIKHDNDEESDRFEEFNGGIQFNVIIVCFQVSSRFWNLFFALNLYWEIEFKKSLDKYEIHAILVSFGLPVAFMGWNIVIIGVNGMDNYMSSFLWPALLYGSDILVLVIFVMTLVLFVRTIILLKRRYANEKKLFRMILRNLVIFPLVSLIYGLLYVVYVIFFGHDESDKKFIIIWAIIIGSQPFSDGMIFGLNQTFNEEVGKCCKRRKSKGVDDLNHTVEMAN